jgi:hypothetical protein
MSVLSKSRCKYYTIVKTNNPELGGECTRKYS